jgi:hypothetical protein
MGRDDTRKGRAKETRWYAGRLTCADIDIAVSNRITMHSFLFRKGIDVRSLLEVFAKEALDLVVAQCGMGHRTHWVAGRRVRGHFPTTMHARPGFGHLYQFTPHTVAAPVRVDVPGFQVADVSGSAWD